MSPTPNYYKNKAYFLNYICVSFHDFTNFHYQVSSLWIIPSRILKKKMIQHVTHISNHQIEYMLIFRDIDEFAVTTLPLIIKDKYTNLT